MDDSEDFSTASSKKSGTQTVVPTNTNWNKIGFLISEFFKCPVILISSTENDRIMLNCKLGLNSNEFSRKDSHTQKHFPTSKEMMVIPDIVNDHHFEQSLLVDKENIHFYVSSPLLSHSNGKKIGTLFLMDHNPRHDFDSEQQLFVREISHILATIICEQRGPPSSDKPGRLERSPSSFMQVSEERVLSLLKIPLRNATILQKTMQDFHRFLTITQKSKSTSPSPSHNNSQGTDKEKIEDFRKKINDRKQLVQIAVELGQLSLQSYQAYLEQTHHRLVVANSSSPVPPLHLHKIASNHSKGRFHAVKEWLNGVKTYMTFLKDPHAQSSPMKKSVGMTKIEWTHEESEYIEIEESPRHCYEIFGKLIEFIILSSYHRWAQISVNVSISDEKDHQRKKPTTDHPHNKPYSDNSLWQRQPSSNSFQIGSGATTALDPTGRIHIDITSHPKQHQTTHLSEEMLYYAQCEEFAQSLLRLIHGSMTIVNRGLGNVNGERKTIMIPCQIREKKVKTSASAAATTTISSTDAVNTSGQSPATPKSEKTINLFHQTSTHAVKRRKSTANKSNKLKKSQFFTDEDDDDDDLAKIEDLDELYGPTHIASASSDESEGRDENDQRSNEANLVDERGMRKNVSVLGEFRHDMVHMKKGKNGVTAASSSLSAKFSASSLASHRSNGNDLSQHGASSLDEADSLTPAPLTGSLKAKSQNKVGFFQLAFQTYVRSKPPASAPAVNKKTASSRFVSFFGGGQDKSDNSVSGAKISVKPQKSDHQQRGHNYHYAHNQSSQFLNLISRFFGSFPTTSTSNPSTSHSTRVAASKKKGSGPPPRGYRQRKVVPVQQKK